MVHVWYTVNSALCTFPQCKVMSSLCHSLTLGCGKGDREGNEEVNKNRRRQTREGGGMEGEEEVEEERGDQEDRRCGGQRGG